MKNPPPPLHSRYPPRKLLLFLLSNTHPAIGVMDAIRRLIGELRTLASNILHAIGVTNTIKLCNETNEVVDIRELRGIITGENNVFSRITLTARGKTDIDPKEYDGADSRGGQLPLLLIFCGGSLLRLPNGDFLFPGEEFFSTFFETVTIADAQPNDQNSTGVVNYEVKFQPRYAPDRVHSLEAVTLDPSKLFASNVVNDPETSLLNMVLEFWPRTFTNLKSKDDLGRTVRVVNDLMRLAKLYNVDRSRVEVAKVVEKVRVLNELRATNVEWYRPLFPGMEDRFPTVAIAEVDRVKLQKFATTIQPLLR
ncbi:uncharacterized protein LOC131315610 [Rhododendron vialii]|uniref:uncharacterized protein LOC131315610 n=1 Tax=Rhododendron vialii TaxID=182163 RepID=UPI00265F042D|nr:uncharacterized protein LOC131315610 [Rhododendron vialii]